MLAIYFKCNIARCFDFVTNLKTVPANWQNFTNILTKFRMRTVNIMYDFC